MEPNNELSNSGGNKDQKLFNLQLTIQKLEEELSLFRNGTTSEE